MVIDYLQGSMLSYTNSERLQTSARIILKHEDGTESFTLFLYHIAYEEMAKSVYCIFLHRGLLDKESESQIFTDHKVKIFLADEIIHSLKSENGRYFLGGKPIGEKPLSDFSKDHKRSIIEHRDKTKKFLYVDKIGEEWYYPEFEIKNLDNEIQTIEDKIHLLSLIRHFLMNDHSSIKFDTIEYLKDSEGRPTLKLIDSKKST